MIGAVIHLFTETEITLRMPTWLVLVVLVALAVALTRDVVTIWQANKTLYIVQQLIDENRALREQAKK